MALAFLPAAHFVALRPLFPFRQAQFAQVFLFKPAPFCNFSVAPTSLPFLCLFSSSQALALCSSSSFLLSQSFWHVWQELSSLSCTIRLLLVLGHSFLQGNDAADELAGGVRYSCPLQSLVVFYLSYPLLLLMSHLNSLVHSSLVIY